MPGPDGFSFSFIRAVWDVLKPDFLDMLLDFHSKGIIKDFVPLDGDWWGQSVCFGLLGFKLVKKLQSLKGKVSKWNIEVFRSLDRFGALVSKESEGLDSLEEERRLMNKREQKGSELPGSCGAIEIC